MPKYTIDGTTLSDVADAVRELDGNPDTMTPAQMATRIRAVQPGGVDLSVIADDYDTTATYDVGDYCIHEGGLYVCTTAISTAEAWTAGHWQEVTVGGELSDLKSDLSQKYTKPASGIPASDIASGVIPDVSGKADKVQSVTSGNFASLDANGNLTDSGHKHSDYLTEHQDLTDYVKNTDYATSSVGGVVKVDADSGTGMHTNGRLRIASSTSAMIKAGTQSYRPIVPYYQHESTFYGLAKAAGDTTQSSSSNAVGTYTDEAKIKIQKMLGVYEEPFRLIKEITITEETGYIFITTDTDGNPFSVKEMIIYLQSVVANNNSGTGALCVNSGNTIRGTDSPYIYVGNMYNSSATTKIINMEIRGGMFFANSSVDNLSNDYTQTGLSSSRNAMGVIPCENIYQICIGSVNGYKFTSGTISIYGR